MKSSHFQKKVSCPISYSFRLLIRIGKTIGKWPLVTILIGLVVAGLCGIGMLKFVQENRGEKLWNPQDSEALAHKATVESRYPVASRLNVALLESNNVLTSQLIKAVSRQFYFDSQFLQ